jgi:hypothetical protein
MDEDLPRRSLGLVIVTQSLLAALFLAGIGAIALLPGFSAIVAAGLPEYADLCRRRSKTGQFRRSKSEHSTIGV